MNLGFGFIVFPVLIVPVELLTACLCRFRYIVYTSTDTVFFFWLSGWLGQFSLCDLLLATPVLIPLRVTLNLGFGFIIYIIILYFLIYSMLISFAFCFTYLRYLAVLQLQRWLAVQTLVDSKIEKIYP